MSSPGGNIIHKFRDTFRVVQKDALRWFPGHMNKGLKQMHQQLKNVDCIIEVHDARVPISGHYADYSNSLTRLKPHIFVLNKMDLADMTLQDSVVTKLKQRGLNNLLFTNFKDEMCKNTKKLLPLAIELIKGSNRFNRSQEESFAIMIIGVPNVGKSSLINRLRSKYMNKRKAAAVGGIAGITRSVSSRIKICEKPNVYVLDTPGILTPRMEDTHSGLKLALAGCLCDHLVDPEVLADYLLFWLNKHRRLEYVDALELPEPNDNILYVLTFIAAKLKKTQRIKHYDGSILVKPDFKFAAQFFLSLFRKGHLGPYCLDQDLLELEKQNEELA